MDVNYYEKCSVQPPYFSKLNNVWKLCCQIIILWTLPIPFNSVQHQNEASVTKQIEWGKGNQLTELNGNISNEKQTQIFLDVGENNCNRLFEVHICPSLWKSTQRDFDLTNSADLFLLITYFV